MIRPPPLPPLYEGNPESLGRIMALALQEGWRPGISLQPKIERGVFVKWIWQASAGRSHDGVGVVWGTATSDIPAEALTRALDAAKGDLEAKLAERAAASAPQVVQGPTSFEEMGL